LDLSALTNWLASLGPYGLLAALAVGYFGPKVLDAIKKKLPNLKLPTAPAAPDLVPLSPAAADPPKLRDLLLSALVDCIRKRQPATDAEHAVSEILARELSYQMIAPTAPAAAK